MCESEGMGVVGKEQTVTVLTGPYQSRNWLLLVQLTAAKRGSM